MLFGITVSQIMFRNITCGIYTKYHYKSCYYLYKFNPPSEVDKLTNRGEGGGGGRKVCKNKMADLPLAKISEKKFRQQEIDLHQFTDEELRSRYRFGRESMKYLVQILKNNLKRQTKWKHNLLSTWLLLHVINSVRKKTWTADCGVNKRTML